MNETWAKKKIEKQQKIFQKAIDKCEKVCYNGASNREKRVFVLASFARLLTTLYKNRKRKKTP